MALQRSLIWTSGSGQRWSYLLCGDLNAKRTVIYFHGFPGTRLEAGFLDAAATARNLRIMAIDRPGFGGSSFLRYPSYQSFAEQLQGLFSHCGISSFDIIAASGGTPFALATAITFGPAVRQIRIVSGLGPLHGRKLPAEMPAAIRQILRLATTLPWLATRSVNVMVRWIQRKPSRMIAYLRTILPPSDRILFRDSDINGLLHENAAEALHQGAAGVAHELGLMTQPWDFPVEQITAPTIFWHGTADRYVPSELLDPIRARLQNARLITIPEGGHFVALSIVDEVLQSLTS